MSQTIGIKFSQNRHILAKYSFPKLISFGKRSRSCRASFIRKNFQIRAADNNSKDIQEFGYSRKDILLLGFGIIGLGYGLYYGAQALGVDAAMAGNYVQMAIFLIICIGYVATYVFRVATKNMTYTQQLKKYEEEVMQKRLEELAPEELEKFMKSVEADRERIQKLESEGVQK